MIREALRCQKRKRNSMTPAFCPIISNAKNPKRILKVHLEFIFFPFGIIVALRADPNKKKLAKSWIHRRVLG